MGDKKKSNSAADLIGKSSNKKADKKSSSGPKYKKPAYFIKLGILVLFVVLIGVLIAIMVANGSFNEGVDKVVHEVTVDDLSKESFTYINDFRVQSEKRELFFVPELYEVLVEMAKMKQEDPMFLRDVSDPIKYLKTQFELENTSSAYAKLFYVRDGSFEELKLELSKGFLLRNILADEKYAYGAVGCDGNYCVVGLYDKWKPVVSE